MSAQQTPVITTTFRGETVTVRATIRDVRDFLPEHRREAFTEAVETTPVGDLMTLFMDWVREATGDDPRVAEAGARPVRATAPPRSAARPTWTAAVTATVSRGHSPTIRMHRERLASTRTCWPNSGNQGCSGRPAMWLEHRSEAVW
ncbi:hypothetical protein [Streptomyces morookaense]|uniref:Uncharacterized protein n=1 Tax=Streptomyces morookaense TaxID=1970 RepID=A0A7Y7E9F8_STRMO|nr:hypothetical protein [Streptomyces morookaense]NVK80386.1 hypothetical protein [Streptomyces morookaense]GHF14399.1 hypothetical protein GCM10010359_14610 [Streptomyces morookaense]